MKLTGKLIVFFVVFAAALLAGVGVVINWSAKRYLETAVISELQTSAIEKESAINAMLDSRQEKLATAAGSPSLHLALRKLQATNQRRPRA